MKPPTEAQVRKFPIPVHFNVYVRGTDPPKVTAECPEAGLEEKEYDDYRQMQDNVLRCFSNLHQNHLAKMGFSVVVKFEYERPQAC